jgi:cytochrome c551/c552
MPTRGKLFSLGTTALATSLLAGAPLSESGRKKARELYSRMGCVGCHQHTHLTQAPKLEAVSEKYAATKGGLALIKTSLASGSLGN